MIFDHPKIKDKIKKAKISSTNVMYFIGKTKGKYIYILIKAKV